MSCKNVLTVHQNARVERASKRKAKNRSWCHFQCNKKNISHLKEEQSEYGTEEMLKKNTI